MRFFAIDIGNTRLKWALYESTPPGAVALDQGAVFLENIDALADTEWKELPPPDAVSPRRPGSVSATARSTALGSWRSDGAPSMNSMSTSSLGRVHFSGSASVACGSASCSKLSASAW